MQMQQVPSTCKFCDIVSGKETAAIIFQNSFVIAFLDVRPLFLGHTLLIPKSHIDTFTDLKQDQLRPFFEIARLLTIAVEKSLNAEGSFIAINNRISQSVPHFHMHVVPRRKGDGLRGFFWPRIKYNNTDELEQIRGKISGELIELINTYLI
jgi:histidine triad (HIT) family protein